MKLRTVALTIAIGVSGLGLAGAGVHAAYIGGDGSSTLTSIAAGGLSVVVSTKGVTRINTPDISDGSSSPMGSSVMTIPQVVTLKNNSGIPVTEIALQLTDTDNNTALKDEMWVCLYSGQGILFNEPLATVESSGQVATALAIAPQATAAYTVIYYAGSSENTGCGTSFTSNQTVSIDGLSSQYNITEPYPTGTTNPEASSLTNPAEGGSITPTITAAIMSAATAPASAVGTSAVSSIPTTTPIAAAAATAAKSDPNTIDRQETAAHSSTKSTPVLSATSVHTGEPWAGSGPLVATLAIFGTLLLGLGLHQFRRRADRTF
jgi:hypothetical protein